MQYCLKCITPISRPRVVFDKNGVCNACNWDEKKKKIDWKERKEYLEDILGCACSGQSSGVIEGKEYPKERHDYCEDRHNIIVPVSGGKDSSYVAWKMEHEFGMNPLCITFSPPIQTKLGRQNLENFRNSGFDLIEIRPNPEVYRRLCKRMFVEQARCKFPFVIGIATAIAKEALVRNIPLVIYGEEGETEYGGSDKFENNFFLNDEYLKIYHEGHDMSSYLDEFTEQELSWWLLPSIEEMKKLSITWWSKYELWDDKLHADLAIEKCGLQTETSPSIGTFTDYAQLDDVLQDLHMYECFIKYGTGRTTADCNLAIKAGRMTRKEAVEYVNKHEGTFPIEYLGKYLDFFGMTSSEFMNVIAKHANMDILDYAGGSNKPYTLKEPVK